MAAERMLDPRDAALAGLLASYRRERAEAWLTTHGTSMVPLIKPGSRVLIEFGARPAIGEVVVFASSGGYVAHRVIGRHRETVDALLIVKGDAEPYPDRALEPAEILGVVRAVRWPAEDRRGSLASAAGAAASSPQPPCGAAALPGSVGVSLPAPPVSFGQLACVLLHPSPGSRPG
jgi:hypothetical protein